MFDTHVNLHGEVYTEDLDDVLARAADAGVSRMLAICDRLDNFERIKKLAHSQPNIWCSVGVHPHYAKDFVGLSATELIDAAADAKVVAIGETGLDFHYGYSAQDDQVANFKAHIEASRTTGLPLIVHTREADQLTGDILEEEYAKGPFPILLHCYTSGAELAQRGLSLGAVFSVSGILSFKNAHDVREVMSDVPLDRIILETDCPYLAPVPMRGRRNEPAYLQHVAEALAELKQLSVEEIKDVTERNALRLFSKIDARE